MQASNLIYVDQPTGTGFSYSSDKRDIRHSEDGVSNDLYDFLQVAIMLITCHAILPVHRTLALCLVIFFLNFCSVV